MDYRRNRKVGIDNMSCLDSRKDFKNQPKGKRNLGRLLKLWKDFLGGFNRHNN
jgi:hypothetical protein